MTASLARRVLKLEDRITNDEPISDTPLPHLFDLRPYQTLPWQSLESYKRSILIWHRRAGKDKLCWNFLIKKAVQTLGVYYYIFPTYSQGKKAIWEGRDKSGTAFLDHIPAHLIASKHNTELKIVLRNGSVIRIVGSDNIDALMGTSPIGVIFSEFALQSPKAWEYIRPILAENKGFAIFNSTPRGKNHLHDLFLYAQENPATWFTSLLTVDDTNSIDPEELARERAEMSEDIFKQEYYCDFTRGQEGSWYGKYLSQVEQSGRITSVPHDPYALVDTFWDLGVGDSTAIIFCQTVGQEIHIIDHYENNGEGLDHYARIIDRKPYKYGVHYAPHDIQVRELASGARTRLEIARDLGLNFRVAKNLSIFEGIELTRSIFSRLWFDESKCKYLLKCLLNYVKRYNEQYNVYSDQPLHNYASHSADAFRMLGVTYAQGARFSKSLAEIEAEDRKYRRRT